MASTGATQHPYYPRDADIPHYVPNKSSVAELLGIFFGLVVVVLTGVIYIETAGSGPPLLSVVKRLSVRVKICWFVVCGLIHCVLEGYFAVYHSSLAGHDTYLGQMWKEYGKGDSRYITSDSFTVAMETITAFIDGPVSFMTAAAYFSPRFYSGRYVLQLIVSLFQLYGDTLYYFTAVLEGFRHSEMWHPIHFWFYFVFLNAFWIIIPLICIFDASVNLIKAQWNSDQAASPIKNGTTKRVKVKRT